MSSTASYARLLETTAMALGYALVSSGIGSVVDSMFPANIPVQDLELFGYTAAQFIVAAGLTHEIYGAILALRPNDAPPPIGEAIAFIFLFKAMPNLDAKIVEIVSRVQAKIREVLHGKTLQQDNVTLSSQGGEPVVGAQAQ